MIVDVLLGLYILASPAGIDERGSSPDLFAHHSPPLPTALGPFSRSCPLTIITARLITHWLPSQAALGHLHHPPPSYHLHESLPSSSLGFKLGFPVHQPAALSYFTSLPDSDKGYIYIVSSFPSRTRFELSVEFGV